MISLFRKTPNVRTSVLEWAFSAGLSVEYLCQQKKIQRTPPRTAELQLSKEFERDSEFVVPDKYLVRIPRARLRGMDGYLQLPDGSYTLELAGMHAPYILGHPVLRRRFGGLMERRRGEWFSMMSWCCRTYYHWMHDVLLRLFGILEHLPAHLRFVVPSGMTALQWETLEILGIDRERCEEFSGERPWEVETLWYAPPNTVTRFDTDESVAWLSEMFHRRFGAPANRRRIYVSRSQALSRRIVNEGELLECLTPHGFEVLHLEAMNLRQQYEAFAAAEWVVAPHGAGLTNLMFCPAGTRVLEVFPGIPEQQTHYWSISNARGLNYHFISADPENRGQPDRNYEVPLDRFQMMLKEVMAVSHEK